MSTDDPDTDTDAEDLAEAFPRVAKLEQELKEADIDVGDIPQRKGTTRRDLLAGSAGLLGLGGVLTAGSGTASAGDGQVGSLGTDGNRLDAEIEDLDLTDQSSTPAGPGSGQVRFYAKNGTLYYKSAGGSETQVGGGAGIFEDTNSDGVYEQTTGSGIETPSVSTGQEVNKQYILQITGSEGLTIYDPAEYADGGTALQQALDDLPAEGGEIRLPPGSLTVNSTISVPSGEGTVVHIFGRGAKDEVEEDASNRNAGTVLTSGITDGSNVMEMIPSGSDRARGNILAQFSIEGTGSEGAGVYAEDWMHTGGAWDVAVYNVGGDGFEFLNCFQQQFYGLRAKDAGGSGFNGDNVNVSSFIKCFGHNCGTHGFDLANSYAAGLFACSAEANGQSGYYARSSTDSIVFSACNAERNTHGYRLEGQRCLISGGSANDNSNNGVFCPGGTRHTINNVYFDIDTQNYNVQASSGVIVHVNQPNIQNSTTDFAGNGLFVLDGWGENSGDPSSTGQWNGNGFEGAAVVDTANSTRYVYRGGAWV